MGLENETKAGDHYLLHSDGYISGEGENQIPQMGDVLHRGVS